MKRAALAALALIAVAVAGSARGALITDSFDRATNADLSVGAPFNWTDVVADLGLFASTVVRANNASSTTCRSRAESALGSADHYAQCEATLTNNTSRFVEVLVRFDAAANTCYGARVYGTSAGVSNVRLTKTVAGTTTALGTGANVTYVAGAVIRCEVEGTTLRLKYNGTLVETITDSSITAGTRTGVGLNGNNTGTAQIDDFEAGDLAAEAPTITYNGGNPAALSYDEGLVQQAVATITATGNPLPTFSLAGADAGDFSIGATSGVITPAGWLRRENPQDADANNVYQVTAVATNSAGSDSVDLTITLQDVGPILFAGRSTAPDASPVDFTAAGAGAAEQQRGVLLWGNLAAASATPVDSAEWGQGFAIGDGQTRTGALSDQLCTAARYVDGETTNVDGHGETYASSFALMTRNPLGDSSLRYSATFDSRIAAGVRVRKYGAGTSGSLLHALVFAGDVRVKVYHVSAAAATNDVTIDFEPNLCLIFGAGDSFPGSLTLHHDGFSQQAIGFAKNDKAGTVTHAGYSWSPRLEDGQNGRAHAMIGSDAYEPWDTNKQPGNDWRIQLSFPNSTTMRLHRLAAEESGAEFAVVCIDTGDRDVAVGIMDFPAAAGSQTPTMTPSFSFTPQAMFFGVSRLTATDSEVTGSSAGTGGYAVVTRPGLGGPGDAEYCVTQSVEDNTATSNSQCRSDGQLFYIPDHQGANAVAATFTNFVPGGLTMNVASAPAATLKMPFFAIAAEADEGGGGLLRALLLYSALDARNKQQSHLDRFGVYAVSP